MAVNVEIVFSGLCSFLNVTTGTLNPELPEPSVILVRTDIPLPTNVQPPTTAPGSSHDSHGAALSADHMSFLGFDSKQVLVSDASGFERFSSKPEFWCLKLDGVLITIQGDSVAPKVEESYNRVLKKDKYWPDAANQYNPDYVPKHGGKPKKSVVNAFLRFGAGTITAGRLSTVQWKFNIPDQPPLVDYFAEEVVYSGFPHTGDQVTINLLDLATEKPIRKPLVFSPRSADVQTLTLFIGNNIADGIVDAFERTSKPEAQPFDGRHIAFLNAVASADVRINGPIPEAVPQPVEEEPPPAGELKETPGGGGSAGFCGPGSANG